MRANRRRRRFPKHSKPYILSDVANDLTANGVLDVEKYTREGQKWIEAGLAEDNEIIPIAGVDFVMSTNVPLIANLPASGKSSYATYISADETMFSIALGGFEDVPDESNFKANIYQFAPTSFDPGGEIGGAVSYNFNLESLASDDKVNTSLYRGTPKPIGQSRANKATVMAMAA